MVNIMTTLEYLAVNIALHYNTMSKVTLCNHLHFIVLAAWTFNALSLVYVRI